MGFLEELGEQWLGVYPNTIGLILVSLIVVYITFRVLKRASRKDKGDAILLLGECGAGKTQLLIQLIYNKTCPTHTSMKKGEEKYVVNDAGKTRTVRVVDVPGHQRLRFEEQTQIPHAAGVVFVVDASDWKVRPVAEHLYELLVNKVVNKRQVPFLIFCNKFDASNPTPSSTIQVDLENELNQLRRTRQAMPQEIGSKDGGGDNIYLGIEGKSFKFDQIQNDVSFQEGSLLGGGLSPSYLRLVFER